MKKILINFFYNLSYQIFSFILPIITMPYITSIISQKTIGINSVMMANSSYFILFGMLGVNIYGAREIAKCQGDKEKLSKVFFKIFKIQCVSHVICLFFYCVYISFISYKLLACFYILNIISSMFDISWFYIGIEDFKSISIRNMIVKLISFFLLFILIKSDSDIYTYVCTLFIPQIFVNIIMWKKLKKNIYLVKKYFELLPSKMQIRDTISLFLPQLSSSVYTLLDKTMLGFFVGFSRIAIYDQGQIIIRLFLSIVPSFCKVMMPRITQSIYNDEPEQTSKYMIMSSNVIWFISIGIFFGIFSISNMFIQWYLPKQYFEVANIIMMCAPIVLAVSGANLISVQFLIPLGKQKVYTLSLVVASIINIILNLIFIPTNGIYGACLSSIISEIFGFVIQLVYASRLINIKDLFFNTPIFIFSGFIMFFVLKNFETYFTSSFLSITFFVLIGISIYTISVFVQLKLMKRSINKIFEV